MESRRGLALLLAAALSLGAVASACRAEGGIDVEDDGAGVEGGVEVDGEGEE